MSTTDKTKSRNSRLYLDLDRYYIYPSQHFHFLLNGWVKAKFVTYNHSRLLGQMQSGGWGGGEAPLNTASLLIFIYLFLFLLLSSLT